MKTQTTFLLIRTMTSFTMVAKDGANGCFKIDRLLGTATERC